MKEKTKNIINSFSYNGTLLEKFLIIYDKAKEEKKSLKLRKFVKNWEAFNNEVDKLIKEKTYN
mgnify:CR=1 FL=1